jgi:mannose-6-phosphate isomerase-like protein (cupin superfamily)
MHVLRKEHVEHPIQTPSGEVIVELVGRDENSGGSEKQSLAHVSIPSAKSVPPHYHKVSEETYFFLKGEGRMVVDDEERAVSEGDAVLIKPRQIHHLYNDGTETLEFVAISGPAWVPDDSFFVEER